MTFRKDFIKKYKLDDRGYSLAELSKITGFKKNILQKVYNRGIGAYKTQLGSVRLKGSFKKNPDTKKFPASKRLSKEQWAFSRVYGFIMNNPKQTKKGQPDHDLWLARSK